MKQIWLRRFAIFLLSALAVSGFAWLMWPQPVLVDVGKVSRGPMQLVLSEEGINRIRDTYTVSAPLTGLLERSSLNVGDKVNAGTSIVARIRPVASPMIDTRTRLELERAVESAKAARDLAQAEVRRAEASVTFNQSALNRVQRLIGSNVASRASLDRAQLDFDVSVQTVATAAAQLDLREHELEIAKARLLPAAVARDRITESDCCVSLTSPVSGSVLRISQPSESVVSSGTPLVEIGDIYRSEIAVDLLSADAVALQAGNRATLSGWGGSRELAARIRSIDPLAFTKVSALGIEEQRVRVLLDLDGPPEAREGLGHNFRVIVNIVSWESPDELQVPVSALVRQGDRWAVFLAKDSYARLTNVEIGKMNDKTAQLKDGLSPEDAVILHPSDMISDGAQIAIRREGPVSQ